MSSRMKACHQQDKETSRGDVGRSFRTLVRGCVHHDTPEYFSNVFRTTPEDFKLLGDFHSAPIPPFPHLSVAEGSRAHVTSRKIALLKFHLRV